MQGSDATSRDGTRLQLYRWSPSVAPIGGVVLVHGGAEHLGRYTHVAGALTEAGFEVAGVDLRGHGRSAGARGYLEDMRQYLEDVDVAVAALGSRRPRFLVGHSL